MMNTMTYEEFMFSQLLTSITRFKFVEYDYLWDKSKALYLLYKGSRYDRPDKPMYDCMEKWIDDNKKFIDEL